MKIKSSIVKAVFIVVMLLQQNTVWAKNMFCLGVKAALIKKSETGFYDSATGVAEDFKFFYRENDKKSSVKSVGRIGFSTDCNIDHVCAYSESSMWNRFEYYPYDNQFTFSISVADKSLNKIDYWVVGGSCTEIGEE